MRVQEDIREERYNGVAPVPPRDTDSGWPPRPEVWPEVMTDIEVCQYLRLDQQHESPASAKRSLRHIRRTRGLPDVGRLGSKVLFRKTAVDAWLEAQERESVATATAGTVDNEGLR